MAYRNGMNGNGRLARGLALAALAMLGGCSWVPNAVNPVAWYRNLSGASKDDALDRNQPNQKNLDAGSKEPYPNLASVPNVPDTALSTLNRAKLEKSLVADREHAQYTAEKLEAGVPAPGAAPAPPPPVLPGASALPAHSGAPVRPAPTSAAKESSLRSPTIPNLPKGESPPPAPLPPNIGPTPSVSAAPGAPVTTAALQSDERRATPHSPLQVAAISFPDGSTALSDAARAKLATVAALQHRQGGALRIVGHARPPAGDPAMQQKLASFKLALARATAVAHALTAAGVPAGAVAVEAKPGNDAEDDGPGAEIFLEH